MRRTSGAACWVLTGIQQWLTKKRHLNGAQLRSIAWTIDLYMLRRCKVFAALLRFSLMFVDRRTSLEPHEARQRRSHPRGHPLHPLIGAAPPGRAEARVLPVRRRLHLLERSPPPREAVGAQHPPRAHAHVRREAPASSGWGARGSPRVDRAGVEQHHIPGLGAQMNLEEARGMELAQPWGVHHEKIRSCGKT